MNYIFIIIIIIIIIIMIIWQSILFQRRKSNRIGVRIFFQMER